MAQPAMTAMTTYMTRLRNRRADAMDRWAADAMPLPALARARGPAGGRRASLLGTVPLLRSGSCGACRHQRGPYICISPPDSCVLERERIRVSTRLPAAFGPFRGLKGKAKAAETSVAFLLCARNASRLPLQVVHRRFARRQLQSNPQKQGYPRTTGVSFGLPCSRVFVSMGSRYGY